MPFVYAGAAILRPALFAAPPPGTFSLDLMFDRALATGRLRGLRLEGLWMHIGTPAAIAAADAAECAAVAARALQAANVEQVWAHVHAS